MRMYWIAENTCTVKLKDFTTPQLIQLEHLFQQTYSQNLIASYVTIDAVTLTFAEPELILEDDLFSLIAEHSPTFQKENVVGGRVVEIPVLYGGEEGPDLSHVAAFHGLTEDEVVQYHTQAEYKVQMIGFVPSFPYLEGLHPAIHTPRKKTPRLSISAGSVGIGGTQTGIYPFESPGGWQIIGKTNIQLFRPDHPSPSILQVGDTVKFMNVRGEAACSKS